MSRVGEMVLVIIGTIITSMLLIFIISEAKEYTVGIKGDFQEQNILMIVAWIFIASASISMLLSIVGVFKISKNRSPKVAGVLFIFAGMLSGAIILYFIAAIMCFVRKTPDRNEEDPSTTMTIKR